GRGERRTSANRACTIASAGIGTLQSVASVLAGSLYGCSPLFLLARTLVTKPLDRCGEWLATALVLPQRRSDQPLSRDGHDAALVACYEERDDPPVLVRVRALSIHPPCLHA